MADESKKPEEQKKPDEGKPSELMSEAMAAYGIRKAHLLASRDYRDHVVIVTKGGSKVSFAPGDKVQPLSKIELDGVPPPKAKK